jgi:hypothetical protein
MRDVMDQLDALYNELLAVEANLYAAIELLGRVPFGRGGIDRRELNRLDHFIYTAHTTVDSMITEFKTAIRGAMKSMSGSDRGSAR